MDYAENLTIPMKEQPQSMYWALKTVTVHSGITKSLEGKTYHPYLSDSVKHDQSFTKIVIKEMLAEENIENYDVIVIDSDNCASQYKSALSFYHLQEMSNVHNITIIRMYGVPGHSKGEVDHVGGTVKVMVRKMAASGNSFTCTTDIVQALHGRTNPCYATKEISEVVLEEAWKKGRSLKICSIEGSSNFHVVVFRPNSNVFQAASRLCVCDECNINYRSCSLFHEMNLLLWGTRLHFYVQWMRM